MAPRVNVTNTRVAAAVTNAQVAAPTTPIKDSSNPNRLMQMQVFGRVDNRFSTPIGLERKLPKDYSPASPGTFAGFGTSFN